MIFIPMIMSTIGFPFFFLLTVSKKVNNLWFSIIFPQITNHFGKNFKDIAPELFKDVKGSNDGSTIKILEIGSGLASNFRFYPKNSKIIALDINPHFRRNAELQASKFELDLERFVEGTAEDLSLIANDSVDYVVATHVLCSITNPTRTVREIRRVLKVGGKFVTLEHVRHRRLNWVYKLQWFLEPLWSVLTGGCQLSRDTQLTIEEAGLNCDQIKYLEVPNMPLTLTAQIFGSAIKIN